MLEEIQELYDYNRWANDRTLGAVALLSEEERQRELGGSFPSLHLTLVHLLSSEWIWLQRWQGTSPSRPLDPNEFSDLAAVIRRWVQVTEELAEFTRALTPERLLEPVSYRTLQGVEYTAPLWQLMRHMANHSTYHRGQITLLIRQLGGTPASTDLVGYHRQKAANAAASRSGSGDGTGVRST